MTFATTLATRGNSTARRLISAVLAIGCVCAPAILDAQGISSAELLASIKQDTSRVPARDIAINAHFDWNSGWETPPAILEALPALPEVLEYRLVNRDLLLVDVGADLVVDVLHDAIQRH